MDINKEDIPEMEYEEFIGSMDYSISTYNLRRMMPLGKKDDTIKNESDKIKNLQKQERMVARKVKNK